MVNPIIKYNKFNMSLRKFQSKMFYALKAVHIRVNIHTNTYLFVFRKYNCVDMRFRINSAALYKESKLATGSSSSSSRGSHSVSNDALSRF